MNKRDEAHNDRRERILDAAEKLFAERGTEAVTVADVAEAADVARATVFNQFGSKHAIVEAITERVLIGYVVVLDDALADRKATTPALVLDLFDGMGRGIEQNKKFYRAMFREIAKQTVGLDEGGPGERVRLTAISRLSQLLTRGQARRELSTAHEADDLAQAFDSLVFGTITHWLYDDSNEDLHPRMVRAARIFLEPIDVTESRTATIPSAERKGKATTRGKTVAPRKGAARKESA